MPVSFTAYLIIFLLLFVDILHAEIPFMLTFAFSCLNCQPFSTLNPLNLVMV